MTSTNFEAVYGILLPTTIAAAPVLLVVVPIVIIFAHGRQEQRRLGQAGGDEFALRMAPSSISKKAIVFAWARSAISILLGLSLLTIFAAKSSHLETSYDYYGPMHILEYSIGTNQMWQSSGLSRQWIIQGSASVQVEWLVSNHGNESMCTTHSLYHQCTSPGLTCVSKPCSSEEVTFQETEVRICIESALKQFNKDTNATTLFQMQGDGHTFSVNSSSIQRQDLPMLPMYGNTSNCDVQSSYQQQKASVDSFAYAGAACLFFGILLLFGQSLYYYVRYSKKLDESNGSSDGDTDCCSVASLDEELGKELEKEEDFETTANESSATGFSYSTSIRHAGEDGDYSTSNIEEFASR